MSPRLVEPAELGVSVPGVLDSFCFETLLSVGVLLVALFLLDLLVAGEEVELGEEDFLRWEAEDF